MKYDEETAQELAKCIVLQCFRNGEIENIHAGKSPHSKTGDYSDVVVKSPLSEIPWSNLSRISDAEMKVIMVEAVNKLYTFLLNMHDATYLEKTLRYSSEFTKNWDKPQRTDDV